MAEPLIHARLWVPGELPALNDMLNAARTSRARGVRGPRRRSAYTDLKRRATELVAHCCRAQWGMRIARLPTCCYTVLVVAKNRRRDPDNLVAGALKIGLDGIKAAGYLKNDGWTQVTGVAGYVQVGDPHGVLIVAAPSLLLRDHLVHACHAF